MFSFVTRTTICIFNCFLLSHLQGRSFWKREYRCSTKLSSKLRSTDQTCSPYLPRPKKIRRPPKTSPLKPPLPSPICTSRFSSCTSNSTDLSDIHLELHAKIPITWSIMLMSRPHHPVKRPPRTPQYTSPIVTTLNTPPTFSSAPPSTSRSPGPQPPSPYRPAGGSPAPPYCGSPP